MDVDGGGLKLPQPSVIASMISTHLCPINLQFKSNNSNKSSYMAGAVQRDLPTPHHESCELSAVELAQLQLREGE